MNRKTLKLKSHFSKGQVDLHKVWLIAGISIGVLALLFFVLFSSRDALFGKAVTYQPDLSGPVYSFGVNVNCLPANLDEVVGCQLELVSTDGTTDVDDKVEAIEFTIEGEFIPKADELVTPIVSLENGGFLTFDAAGTTSALGMFTKGTPIMVSQLQTSTCIDSLIDADTTTDSCEFMPAGVFGSVNMIVGTSNNVHLENVKIVVKEGESYVDVCTLGTGSCDNGVVNVALDTCGDGTIQINGNDGVLGTADDEQCDGTNLNGYFANSCNAIAPLLYQDGVGTLACASNCQFDTTQCVGSSDEVCDDRRDNDLDTYTDCADSDCNSENICSEEVCTGNFDNDGDGYVDCEDSDCAASEDCEVILCPSSDWSNVCCVLTDVQFSTFMVEQLFERTSYTDIQFSGFMAKQLYEEPLCSS